MEKLLQSKFKPSESEMEYFINSYKTLRMPMDFLSYKWCPFEDEENMVELCVHMMKDMLEPQLATNDPLLFELTCIVRNTYRDLPYHNFEHAVGVMHCAYIILKRNRGLFDQIEVTSIMISALCHDVDHPGLTNSFLVTINHPLAKLYEKSPLEHHHYYLCYYLLKNFKIFQHLDSNEYSKLMNNIKNNILATDLAVFLERRRNILKLKRNKAFNIISEPDRSLMKSILMTACDLSSTCKPFPPARMYTEAIIKEFYEQGDKEKMLGLIPASIMNRDLSARLPEEQVRFYVSLALPCYSLLVQIIPNTEQLYYGCLKVYFQWQLEVDKKSQPVWKVEESYLSAE
ncbi:cAMP and cAMP-inhibited cGMP 3',5'-cyclic phosphodiesterase 10A-like [Ischnura elegans]|uniref:cAMP and cAMP-inhibited cGMP 3',5'-cyclic phosphodiesterase 10A-like n=1 Tax=Ischnura elegans TaxID=197161 RepID=UPI001ED873A6|nr:cAMP and cAMP-inhibited cGMP 3',5'-cyclic phosphodiesterase 10A-like [Ischnura elegans]